MVFGMPLTWSSDDAHELWMCFFNDPDGNVLALMSEVPIG